ncbi:MAG TPA: lamin tail domain-containing protein [Candidatus Limnocylindria bacterium]|nr:lamin tail domain-containing protein [Candidatus Limnocylindria bacterium]
MPLQRGFSLVASLALLLGAVLPFAAPSATRAAPTDLFFSEYIEGSSNNKALEIYNGTGAPVNLAAAGYSVQMFFNGSSTAGLTINLTGSVGGGDVYVVAQASADADILAQADQTNSAGWFNGDDAVALVKAGTILDVIGQIGSDPGTQWGSGLTSTADNTLRRKAAIEAGDQNGADAFDPATQWDGFATDTFDGLGVHGDGPTNPAGTGTADPQSVLPGQSTGLSVEVTPGTNPPSTGLSVTGDLSAIGGNAAQAFAKVSDTTTFSLTATVAASTAPGTYMLSVTIADAENRTATTDIALVVQGASTTICEIQGASHTSPMVGADVFAVQGIVTAAGDDGFWMTDPDCDESVATSDGIFVFGGEAAPGDLVAVDGSVEEFGFDGELTTTEIGNATVTVLDTGLDLPTTVIGVDRTPPTEVIDDDGMATFDPETDGIDFWESLESMRLEVRDAIAVGPTNGFGETAVVSQLTPSGESTERGGIIVRELGPDGDYRPGDFNPERLITDDELVDTTPVNTGDEFGSDPVGVLDYSFGNFKLFLTSDPGRVDNHLVRETTTEDTLHELSVATFNVENLSARSGDAKVNELAEQIVVNLKSPDIIAIEEMQDNNGSTNDGTVAADLSWQRLIDAIVAAGGPRYDYRQIDPVNNADGGQPGGNIRVGFLFDKKYGLQFVDRAGGDAVTDTDVVRHGNDAALTVSPGRILDSQFGDLTFFDTRKSLVGEFLFRGEPVFVIANHFSSKGDDEPLFGANQPPRRFTEFKSANEETVEDGWRHAQAQAVNDFVDEILAVDPDAQIVVLGDINDFDFSETVEILTGERVALAGGPDPHDGSGPTAETGDEAVLTTLFDLLDPDERYSYVFDGNSQVLDQILVSQSLLALDPVYDVVHVNAEFFEQASDHDPSVMRVEITPRD